MSGQVDNTEPLAALREKYPGIFVFTHASTHGEVEGYLAERGLLPEGASVTGVRLAGDVFNMNCTLRVSLEGGAGPKSVIVKQARPFVERYPSIEAPFDRVQSEFEFFSESAKMRPQVTPTPLGYDPLSRVLIMQDVGRGDWGILYEKPTTLPSSTAAALGVFLASLHGATSGSRTVLDRLAADNNGGMRELTYNYCFHLPLEGGDLEAVTEGLTAEATILRADTAFKTTVAELGAKYLLQSESGGDWEKVLVHGDFFPAAWMLGSEDGAEVYVIDAEFCHFGLGEHDVGFALAHLVMVDNSTAASALYSAYKQKREAVNTTLVIQMCGVEVMRRLIGIAQLPFGEAFGTLARKKALLAFARRCVMEPSTVDPASLVNVASL